MKHLFPWATRPRTFLVLCAILCMLFPSGAWANDELTWYGFLDSRPSSGIVGPWVVGGKTFVGTQSTVVYDQGVSLTVGVCTEVNFTVSNDTKVATKIVSRDESECSSAEPPPPPPVVTSYGALNAFPQGLQGDWTIGQVAYTTDNTTVFKTEKGAFAVGICVRVDFVLVDGGRVAKGIGTMEQSQCTENSNPTVLPAIGRINSFPSGRLGDWIVNQTLYQADTATTFDDSNGAFAVGACVKITFLPTNGLRLAKEIETQSDSVCEGSTLPPNTLLIYGKINTFPSARVGDWLVSQLVYKADSTTVFNTNAGPFGMGVCVRITFVNMNDGRLAREITSQGAYQCPSGDSALRGEAKGVLASFPPNLVGAWVIGSTTYTTTLATRFHQEKGPFFTGSCLKIQFAVNTTTALEIGTIDPEECRERGGAERKAFGRIKSIPTDGIGPWGIGPDVYTSTLETEFDEERGPLAIGACAEVKFSTALGSNSAIQISTTDPYKCGGDGFLNRAYGVVQSMPTQLVGTWVISDTSYETTSATSFEQPTPIAVGSCVAVAYYTKDGVRIAQRMVKREMGECSGPPAFKNEVRKIFAPVDTVPASPYVGAWKIGGVDFIAASTTRLEPPAGPFVVGDCVEAKYVVSPQGNQLLSVNKKRAERCGGLGDGVFRAFGPISSFPDTLLGTWVIGDLAYQSTITTTLEQSFGIFAVGAFVEVQFQIQDGTRVATKIETHVAPGDGRDTTTGNLEARPDDDTGEWVIDGVSYTGDSAIEVDLNETEGGRTRASGTSAARQLVTVNSYTDADGNRHALSISAGGSYDIYIPLVQR